MKPLTGKPSNNSTTVGSPSRHERGPKDLLRDEPPPDPKSGLTPQETMSALEDATRAEQSTGIPGVFNMARVSGRDKCGANMGRCFGEIVRGKCSKCGADYTRTSGPPGGVNLPRILA